MYIARLRRDVDSRFSIWQLSVIIRGAVRKSERIPLKLRVEIMRFWLLLVATSLFISDGESSVTCSCPQHFSQLTGGQLSDSGTQGTASWW